MQLFQLCPGASELLGCAPPTVNPSPLIRGAGAAWSWWRSAAISLRKVLGEGLQGIMAAQPHRDTAVAVPTGGSIWQHPPPGPPQTQSRPGTQLGRQQQRKHQRQRSHY